MKNKKEQFKKEMESRVGQIIKNARKADAAYRLFETDRNKRSINNYFFVKSLIDSFYKDGSEEVQVSKFGSDTFKIYMLESFKTVYPKQYKQIIKQLEKENISVDNLIKFKHSHFETVDKKQREREEYLSKLVNEMGETNNYKRETVQVVESTIMSALGEQTKMEREKAGAPFEEINGYKFVTQAYENILQASAKKDMKNTKEKTDKNHEIEL